MALRSNYQQWRREVEQLRDTVREEWRGRAIRVGAFAFARMMEHFEDSGSVDTGATRAETLIEQDGRILFESPDRVGPDERLPSQKRLGLGPLIGAPDIFAAEAALRDNLATGRFSIVNRRFTIEWLEFGTANIEPRQIFARTADATDAYAASVAVEPLRGVTLRSAA
jgi:hypothetical protein